MTFNGFDFDRVVADYLNRFKDNWDGGDFNIHASEVGYCPRKMAYRMIRVPKIPLTAQKVKMFNLGNYIHGLVYRSLDHSGLLYDKEQKLNEWLPEGVGGTFDYRRRLVKGDDAVLRLGDIKSMHPNMIKYTKTLPKVEAVVQASLYHAYHPDQERLDKKAEILYTDRGGQNPSALCEFTPLTTEALEGWLAPYYKLRADIIEFIGDIERPAEEWVGKTDDCPLPPPLGEDLKWSYRNKWGGGNITFGVPWSCGKSYCQFKMCPNWDKKTRLVVKVNKSYGYSWSPIGRRLMQKNPDRMASFLFPRSTESKMAALLASIQYDDSESQWDDIKQRWITTGASQAKVERASKNMGLPHDEADSEVGAAERLTGAPVNIIESEGEPDDDARVFGDD